jgi:hypothetical protein
VELQSKNLVRATPMVVAAKSPKSPAGGSVRSSRAVWAWRV